MIAITGANGHLGQATIGFLLEKIAPENIVAIVRNPQKIENLAARGIKIRVAEYDDPASLNRAFQGIEKVLQISAISTGEQGQQQENNVVNAAREQGVKHIVYTSALKASHNAHFFSAQQCLQTEKAILNAGLPYTFVRNSLYSETIPQFIGNALQDGAIYFPAGQGQVSFVCRTDIAEALSVVLTEDKHTHKVYEITGSKAFSFEQLAEQIQAVKGVPVAYVDIPTDVLREELAKIAMPTEEIEWFISLADSIKSKEFAHVDTSLETLLLRKPVSLESYLKNL